VVKYTKDTVDELINILRMYARAHMPLTKQLAEALDEVITSDIRLNMYYNKKVLRYPTVKKYFIAHLIVANGVESEDGIGSLLPELNGKIGKSVTPTRMQEEPMFR